jgi:U3 small nucleolar RNA-associated protein 5
MSAVVRSRKAAASEVDSPPAKRSKKNDSSKHLDSALFTNGAPKTLKAVPSFSLKPASSHQVNESNAVISQPQGHASLPAPNFTEDAIVISSDESSEDNGSEEEDEEEEGEDNLPRTNGNTHPEDQDSDKENGNVPNQTEEPTFGELLQSLYPEDVVHVDDHFDADAVEPESQTALTPVSGASLTTVLHQALRTNDQQLLESCLITTDLDSVRTTISRMKSVMAVGLLQAIAERLYSRPGRANNLMVWLQWTIVAHGGYLASQPDITKALGSLYRVVKERAGALQPLLSLKGKLDMLAAQMELRKRLSATHRGTDDGVVIYVEGEEDDIVIDAAGNPELEDSEEDVEAGAITLDVESDASDSDSSEDEIESESDISEHGFSDRGGDDLESDEEESEEEEASLTKKKKTRRG